MEDRKLERELTCLGTIPCEPAPTPADPDKPKSKGMWKVYVKTGDQPDAGTKDKVMLRLFGERRQKAGPFALEGKEFEANQEAEFEVSVIFNGIIHNFKQM